MAGAGVVRRIAASVVVAVLVSPAAAAGYRGDGVFTLATGHWLDATQDLAMLPDDSIVVGRRHLTPDGRQARIRPMVGGLGVTADGSVLMLENHRILRWRPGFGASVVAGTGVEGFGGDGGPAVDAQMDFAQRLGPDVDGEKWATGIVAAPDGGFVFTDTGNHRIRAVDGAGIIRTLAGGTPGTLGDPIGLAATSDGDYLVTEADGGRVLRVTPDGHVAPIARLSDANDVAVLGDASAVISQGDDESGDLWRLAPGSRRLRPYLRPARAGDTVDFAAREVRGEGLAADSRGGLLALGPQTNLESRHPPWRLTYVPDGPTPWTLVALRDTRTTRRAVRAVIEATQPGAATLEVVAGRRVVARVTRHVSAGHSTLRASGPIADRWYDVRVTLAGSTGATARDEVPIHGARALTVRLARRLLGRDQGEADDAAPYTLGPACRRFGQRRVDCEIRDSGLSCAGVASVTLGRTGVVLRRHYRCGHRRFRRRPRYIVNPPGNAVQRLSRHEHGYWDTP